MGHCNESQALAMLLQVEQGYLSQPETIAFPTTGGKTAYMNHYPPANQDFQLPGEAALSTTRSRASEPDWRPCGTQEAQGRELSACEHATTVLHLGIC